MKINAPKMEMRAFGKKQKGRKLITSFLYAINEVKFSIYNLSKLRSQKQQKVASTGRAKG